MALSEAYNVDCMLFMANLKDNSYSVGSVDPVYGINGNSHRKNENRGKLTKSKAYHDALWSQEKTPDSYFIELRRVTENQIIFGANYFSIISGSEFKTPRRNEYKQFLIDHPTNWIIWDKVNSSTSFNDCELIWTSFPIESHIFYFMWSGMMQGRSFKDGRTMNPYKHKNQKRIHPTEKPFEVYKYLLQKLVIPGMSVFDSHLGSGSQRIICFHMDINFTGTEIEKKYFDDQETRFSHLIKQTNLY